jgi:hypothetical protein
MPRSLRRHHGSPHRNAPRRKDAAARRPLRSVGTPGLAQKVTAQGSLAYVADNSDGLQIARFEATLTGIGTILNDDTPNVAPTFTGLTIDSFANDTASPQGI